MRDAALEAGLRAALIVPLIGAEGPLGALVLRRRCSGEFSETVISLMQAFAVQSASALENARLFEEIARKSRELEVASQHKSQFVANMSHELRTPLAAMLGYAELLRDGMFGGLVSSTPSWAVPAVVVAYLVGGPVAALIGGLAQAGLTAGVTYYNGKRKAGRDHAVSYLLRLVDEKKPLLAK